MSVSIERSRAKSAPPLPHQTRRFDVVALLLVAALLAAVSLAFFGESCSDCQIAEAVQPVPGLKWLGIYAYAILLIARLRTGGNVWTHGILFGVLGAHVYLATNMVYLGFFCLPCSITAICIAAASALSLRQKRVSWKLAAAALVGGLIIFGGAAGITWKINRMQLLKQVKQDIDFQHLARTPGSRLTLHVFTRTEECPHCRDLEQIDLKNIKERYGNSISISRHQAPPGPVPILVFVGRDKKLVIGRPKKPGKIFKLIDYLIVD